MDWDERLRSYYEMCPTKVRTRRLILAGGNINCQECGKVITLNEAYRVKSGVGGGAVHEDCLRKVGCNIW